MITFVKELLRTYLDTLAVIKMKIRKIQANKNSLFVSTYLTTHSAISSSNFYILFLISIVTGLPVVLSRKLWLEIWRGVRPRAWDGTGHFAIAQIFDAQIFPNTFGWTQAYFSGMPFPNFYPPLFYWLVAAIHRTRKPAVMWMEYRLLVQKPCGC